MANRKAKSAIQEFPLIRGLSRRFARHAPGLVQGIGDDAAVIEPTEQTWWHVTTDLLAEGIHFNFKSAASESIGYRAAMANLSDLAAMGATPRYLLISLAIPKTLRPSHIFEVYTGLMKACRQHRVALIGGDTSASKTGLFLNITLLGTTPTQQALFRHGAHVGDLIYVTGTLGDSLAGLRILTPLHTTRRTGKSRIALSRSHQRFLIGRHFHPTARVAEGQWLNQERLASAAIDLSDGLSGDLRHLCTASRVGAEIDLEQLPISAACRAYGRATGRVPIQLALAGGEDYELLFTAAPGSQDQIAHQARTRGYRVTCIGTIRPKRFGIQMSSGGRRKPLPVTSYEHFH
ncbi:MAG TPA: thiamine-phosphate kinase [Nitrospira sp.]|nr:thiamine-phosphate kinase [Nitrospira sp.]